MWMFKKLLQISKKCFNCPYEDKKISMGQSNFVKLLLYKKIGIEVFFGL